MDRDVVIDTTITDNVLSFIGKHEETDNVQLRLACATMPYNRILVCVFNVTSVGFEYKQNESCLVTFGKDGEIKDALYLGINDSLPVFVPFNYYGIRNVPKDTVPMCKWIYNRSNDLYLTTFKFAEESQQRPLHGTPWRCHRSVRLVRGSDYGYARTSRYS